MPSFHGRNLAVNVKVGADCFDATAAAEFPGLTREWITSYLSDREIDAWWSEACRFGWERAEEAAQEAFGPSAKVWSEGRSGGWLVVEVNGRTLTREDVEEWEGADLLRWAAFEQACKELAADTPYQFTYMIGANLYRDAMAEGFAALADAGRCAGLADSARSFWGSAPYGVEVAA